MAATDCGITVGELVTFQEKLCKCIEKNPTELGWNNYVVRDLVTGQNFRTNKHKLSKIDVISEIPEAESQTELSEVETIIEFDVDWDLDTPLEFEDVGDTPQENVDAVNIDNKPDCDKMPEAEQRDTGTKHARHDVLTAQELDEIANERLSANTQNQTKWAIKLFKGE